MTTRHELGDQLRSCLQNYYLQTPSPRAATDYATKFASQGGGKARRVLEWVRKSGLNLERLAYVSIGGADGSEILEALDTTELRHGVLLELSDTGVDNANRQKARLQQQGKELCVLQGDAFARVAECRARLEQWGARNVDGVICSAQAVLHELPVRSHGYQHHLFFGPLYSVFPIGFFHSREPVKVSEADWPPCVWLRVGTASAPTVGQSLIVALGTMLVDKFARYLPENVTAASIQVARDHFVQLPRDVAREVVRAVVYWDNADHFKYETGEYHSEIDPSYLAKVIGNCLGADVRFSRTNSNTFASRYDEMGIVALSPEGDPLPVPLVFAEFTGAKIPSSVSQITPEVRSIYPGNFADAVNSMRGQEPSHLQALRAALSDSQFNPAIERQQLPLKLRFAATYDDLANERFSSEPFSASDLLHRLPSRVLISAPGGAGKSSTLCATAVAALERGYIPYYVSAAAKQIGSARLPAEYSLAEFLDQLAIAGQVSDFFASLASGKETILLIDGLNEVYREASEQILRWLSDEVGTWQNLSVIIADRMVSHRQLAGFQRASIVPLELDDVRAALQRDLPTDNALVSLLRLPFFLDLQLGTAAGDTFATRSGMIRRYFAERVGVLVQEDWDRLTACAFHSYQHYRARTFAINFWAERIAPHIATSLETSGVIVDTERGAENVCTEDKRFRHQLLHDYLVGCYLSGRGRASWNPEGFDASTFRANSNESLTFAVEVLGAPAADDILVQIYDWNYHAAVQCIVDATEYVREAVVSAGLRLACAALIAEKRFDLFEETARSATALLARIKSPDVSQYGGAPDLKALLEIVAATYKPQTGKDTHWLGIFLRHEALALDADIALLDGDPVTGWTAANVLRRTRLTPELERLVKHVYRANLATDRPSHRWRAVHVLGCCPSEVNASFLWKCLIEDPSAWVRYGAVRCLMEIAFRLNALREDIVERFMRELPSLAARVDDDSLVVLREIGRGCLISPNNGGSREWYQKVYPLASAVAAMPAVRQDADLWRSRLTTIRERME